VTREIDGWLGDGEGLLLYNLAKKCASGVIVEIGSWKGNLSDFLKVRLPLSRQADEY
jgi:hypothetical protein